MNDKMDKEISELLFKNAFEEYENARCDEIIGKYKDTEPEYSEEHKRRMEKLFKKEKKSFCWNKFAKRAAMVVLAVFLSGALALQVEAVRIKIENWYYEITGEAIHIGNSVEDLPGYSETDMPIYVLSDEFVDKYGLGVTQTINERMTITEYDNINNSYIKIFCYSEKNNLHIDSDNASAVKQKINGKNVLLISSENKTTMYWEEREEAICIYTNFPESVFYEILKNIVKK